jgi:hypothetical protein
MTRGHILSAGLHDTRGWGVRRVDSKPDGGREARGRVAGVAKAISSGAGVGHMKALPTLRAVIVGAVALRIEGRRARRTAGAQ